MFNQQLRRGLSKVVTQSIQSRSTIHSNHPLFRSQLSSRSYTSINTPIYQLNFSSTGKRLSQNPFKKQFFTQYFTPAFASTGIVQEVTPYQYIQPASDSVASNFDQAAEMVSDAASISSKRLQNVGNEFSRLGQDVYHSVDDSLKNRSDFDKMVHNLSRWIKRTLKQMFPTDYNGVMLRLADVGYYSVMGFLSLIGLSVLFAFTSVDGSNAHSNSLTQSLWGYWFPTGLTWGTLYTLLLIGNYAVNSIHDEVNPTNI